jgi:hypothetical protein
LPQHAHDEIDARPFSGLRRSRVIARLHALPCCVLRVLSEAFRFAKSRLYAPRFELDDLRERHENEHEDQQPE